jgi:hypothetical protein
MNVETIINYYKLLQTITNYYKLLQTIQNNWDFLVKTPKIREVQ